MDNLLLAYIIIVILGKSVSEAGGFIRGSRRIINLDPSLRWDDELRVAHSRIKLAPAYRQAGNISQWRNFKCGYKINK